MFQVSMARQEEKGDLLARAGGSIFRMEELRNDSSNYL